jgi:transcription termination factor Rho
MRPEPVVEVSRQIGTSTSEASFCSQPLSHEDEAMLLASVSKRVVEATELYLPLSV